MLKKIILTFAALMTAMFALSGRAIAYERAYLAEEVENYYSQAKPTKKFLLEGAQTEATGTIVVKGDASPFQIFNRVKAVKCSPSVSNGTIIANKKSCTDTVYFGINEPKALTVGFYILGFENSIYPGFVQVSAGEEKTINLQKISIPGNGVAKVYRNLSSSVEQKKMMFTQFQLGKAFFSLATYDFGDLYLRKFPLKDLMPNIEYSYCESVSENDDPQAKSLCRALDAKTFIAMKEFFEFNSDSTHAEYVPRTPGDAFKYTFDRLLVSAPTVGAESFVNVFPGEYTIETSIGGKTSKSNVSTMEKDAAGKSKTSFGLE